MPPEHTRVRIHVRARTLLANTIAAPSIQCLSIFSFYLVRCALWLLVFMYRFVALNNKVDLLLEHCM